MTFEYSYVLIIVFRRQSVLVSQNGYRRPLNFPGFILVTIMRLDMPRGCTISIFDVVLLSKDILQV